jgi:enoyl-CoA hydratase/carnithine racemase
MVEGQQKPDRCSPLCADGSSIVRYQAIEIAYILQTPPGGAMTDVRVSTPHPGVGLILIDAPPMNFATPTLMEPLEQALIGLREDATRVVVIASAVEGYFIGHGDIGNLLATLGGIGDPVPGDPMARLRVHKELDRGPMVSIAAVDGQAWGGGAELAWTCDLRVASTISTFGQPEVIIGLPTLDGAARIARLVGEATAKRIVLDGRPIPAEEAYRLGLVHRLVPAGAAVEAALEWAQWLAGHPPWALAASKELINGGRELSLRDALRRETALFVEAFTKPEVVEQASQIQARYDNGADPYDAFGVDRGPSA